MARTVAAQAGTIFSFYQVRRFDGPLGQLW
jgi:hypothetical protein